MRNSPAAGLRVALAIPLIAAAGLGVAGCSRKAQPATAADAASSGGTAFDTTTYQTVPASATPGSLRTGDGTAAAGSSAAASEINGAAGGTSGGVSPTGQVANQGGKPTAVPSSGAPAQ